MKISVVTISYNQVEFLERTIQSVISQKDVDFEYIMVDPGSTDGSRELIGQYRAHFSTVVLEKDQGAADGLNKGFARASGDIFFYLNSDDAIVPGAFAAVLREFERDPSLDIVCGHTWFIDRHDRRIRRAWSDRWWPPAQAYGAAIQIQPSTYFRAELFRKVGGFNVNDRRSWDGELFDRMALTGAKMKVIDAFLSEFRMHLSGWTGSRGNGGSDAESDTRMWNERFRRIKGRDLTPMDRRLRYLWKVYRQLHNPRAFLETLRHGTVYEAFARAERDGK
jgi:glycosyltransferase involved in cell wall biosynthesis